MAAKVQGVWEAVGFGDVGKPGNLAQIDTVAAYPLGTTVKAVDTGATAYGLGEFTYVKGVASVAAGDVCVIKPSDGSLVRVTARSKGPVGLALSALTTATKWGWVQTKGTGVANCGTVGADVPAYALGAGGPGTLDDAVVTGDMVVGMYFVTGDDTSTAVVTFPNGACMNDIDNA